MKRQLILIRHTKSDWGNALLKDFDRPIKKERVMDAQMMAQRLKELNLKPELIICSPAKRTQQTAAFFCDALDYRVSKIQLEPTIYESSEAEIVEAIHHTAPAIVSLMVIAHNPSLTYFANLFLRNPINNLPTTGTLWFEFDSEDWLIGKTTPCELKYYFTPKGGLM